MTEGHDSNNTNAPTGRVVHQEKLSLLLQQSYVTALISVIVAAMLVGILWHSQSQPRLLVWLAGILLLATCCITVFQSFRRRPLQLHESKLRERAFYFASMCYFAWWSLGTLWIMPKDSFVDQVIILYFMMGLAGAAMVIFPVNWPLQISAVALLILPIVSWFFFEGSPKAVGLATVTLFFLLSAVRSSKVLAGTIHSSLGLKHRLIAANTVAERLARIDELTNLYNRRAFNEYSRMQAAQALRTGQPLSLVLMDLDHFKEVNDSYGHTVGDEVLQHVSQMLQSSVRESDVCGRIGGEEFALLLPNTTAEQAESVAQTLRQRLHDNPFLFADGEQIVHASFGVAQVRGEFAEALRQADTALYAAKSRGRNRVETCDNISPIRFPGGRQNRRR